MSASLRRRSALVLGAALLFAPLAARADSRTDFLVERLKADDFRVRTNAALALGATNDDAAVRHLCTALDDTSEVVRQASAVALKRLLKPASLQCLRAHQEREKNDSVKLQMSRAVEAIEASAGATTEKPAADPGGGAPGEAPALVKGAKFYVAIAPVTNNSSRAQADIDKVVAGAVRSKLEGPGQHQLAPSKEPAEAARAVMQKRKLKGFYLTLSLDKFNYTGGQLSVTVRMVIFNYPGKAMQGMLSRTAGPQAVSPGDRAGEDAVIQAAVESVLDGFAQNAARF
jgi:hypothetical protein